MTICDRGIYFNGQLVGYVTNVVDELRDREAARTAVFSGNHPLDTPNRLTATEARTDNILTQAAQIVYGANQKAYGRPSDDFDRIARMWSALLSKKLVTEIHVDSLDVAKMMVAVKLSRLVESPAHMDSWRDVAGYAACGERVIKNT
jgi:hypothetical protein